MACDALYGVPAPAKINWFLHVLGRRADGYHELQTVFQFIDWYDRIDFERRADGVISRSGGPGLPDDDLCVRAARLLQRRTGCRDGVAMHLHKSIPAQAGLGGGSSDAATTLLALNRLWGLRLPRAALLELALQLGADVPVFVFGRNAFAGGVGERLQAVELPEWDVLVGWPGQGLATAAMFGDVLLRRDTPALSVDEFVAAQRAAGATPALSFGRNDLQPVAEARLLQRHAGCRDGVAMHLHKSIPAQAGLGGGSSDAATTLLALNRLWGLRLPRAELLELALQLGADVPVFVYGRNAFAGGVGERLHAVELPEWDLLVGWPGRGLATAAMFGDAALRRDTPPLGVDDFNTAQRAAGAQPALSFGRNDLQPVAQARLPELAALVDWLAAHGSGTPRMSGSGSALFVAGRADSGVGTDADELPADWQLRACRALRQHPLLDWADGADATV